MLKSLSFFAALAALPMAAQLPLPTPTETAAEATETTHPVVLEPQRKAEEPPPLPEEQRAPRAQELICAGIVILENIQSTLAAVQDKAGAEAAVAPLMRAEAVLKEWADSFNTLPPLSAAEQAAYEDTYLPTIEKLNARIRSQADRLASAEYYGSQNLPAALIRLSLLNQ